MKFNDSKEVPSRDFLFSNLGFGLGLRSPHYGDIINLIRNKPLEIKAPAKGLPQWFEALTENYLFEASRPRQVLREISKHYPIALHGVSLSLGGDTAHEKAYLKNLACLIDEIRPAVISDHCCWTAKRLKRKGPVVNSHDLLPLPYTHAALNRMIERTKRVQDLLGRRILVENVSSYLEFSESIMPEYEFLSRLAEAADCGILLDINNVFVSSWNHVGGAKIGTPEEYSERALGHAIQYLKNIPALRVGQFHLAGHRLHSVKGAGHDLPFRIDTHDEPLCHEVIELFKFTWKLMGPRSTMIEWDAKIPTFEALCGELSHLKQISSGLEVNLHTPASRPEKPALGKPRTQDLTKLQTALLNDLLGFSPQRTFLALGDETFSDALRFGIYSQGVKIRFLQNLKEDFPRTMRQLGRFPFEKIAHLYLKLHPSRSYTLFHLGQDFPKFLKSRAKKLKLPAYVPEIAQLEYAILKARLIRVSRPHTMNFDEETKFRVTPGAELISCRHKIFHLWERTLKRRISVPQTSGGAQCILIHCAEDSNEVSLDLLTPRQIRMLKAFSKRPLALESFFRTRLATAESPEYLISLIKAGILKPTI